MRNYSTVLRLENMIIYLKLEFIRRDLTTLTRTKNATLSHDGLRFTASCGFGFSKAKINYEKYKVTNHQTIKIARVMYMLCIIAE